MMVIDTKFEIGEYVYLKTDPDQNRRLVTGMYIRSTSVLYLLSLGASESTHYDFEVSTEKSLVDV